MKRIACFKSYFIKLSASLLFLALFTVYFFSTSLSEARSSSSIQEKSQTSAIVDGVETTGEQKTLVALFNYADDQREPISLNTVKNWIMYDTQSINNFVKENSYNKTWLNPTFIDWRTLPSDSATYKDGIYLALYDAVKLLDDEVDFQDYKRLVFFFLPWPRPGGGEQSWAAGTSGVSLSSDDGEFICSVAWLPPIDPNSLKIMTHEVGHGFGFAHANSLEMEGEIKVPPSLIDFSPGANPDIGTYSYDEYGDTDDTMGGGYNHWSAGEKNMLGWFEPSQVETVTQSGEYVLDQVELPSDGIKMLKIPLGKDIYGYDNSYYFLEYRKPLGLFDDDDEVQVRSRSRYLYGNEIFFLLGKYDLKKINLRF